MEITVFDLLKKDKALIIDIRNHSKYLMGHIPGAISIDSYSLLFHPESYLEKEKTYYLYCDSGIRSRALVERLNAKGYSTVHVIGGYNNYLLRK